MSGVVTTTDGVIPGRASVYLQGDRGSVRTEETNLGNVTADANLWQAQQYDPTVAVSIKNGGGIRESIGFINAPAGSSAAPSFEPTQANADAGKAAGDISQLDIQASLRFNNELTLLTLTRAQLVETLEHALSQTEDGATPGRFAQVSGVSYAFDASKPVGDRIESAAIVDNDGIVQDVLVVNSELVGSATDTVRIVTLSFLVGGGDSYPFQEFVAADATLANRVDLGGTLTDPGNFTFADPGTEQDAFAEYLNAFFTVTPGVLTAADTTAANDQRIQNLTHQSDDVMGQGVGMVSSGFYLSQNHDVAAAGIDPTTHYYVTGWAEGRDPNAWFDTSYYLDQNPDVAAAGVNPLLHYMTTGWREHRDPSAHFNTSVYLEQNADVAAALDVGHQQSPLEHFILNGIEEGRITSELLIV